VFSIISTQNLQRVFYSLLNHLCGLTLTTDPEVLGSIPGASRFSEAVGLERGPLSLVSITEELLGRNSSGSGQENREYDWGRIRCADRTTPSIRKSLYYFAKKWRSLGRHSSLADQRHGGFFFSFYSLLSLHLVGLQTFDE
jgi:hypothetical protein